MTTNEIIELATYRLDNPTVKEPMLSSAALCLSDARYAARHGNDAAARLRATKSLQYTVGIFHEDYRRVIE